MLKANERVSWRLSAIFSMLSLCIIYYFQWCYASPYAASWDQVDFALALGRYDLLAMQPHFPGYPYFILGGIVVHQFINNPAQALAVFNSIMMLSAVIPIYLLAKRYQGPSAAWVTTVLIQSASYMVLTVTQPMSEGSAMAAVWWYFWSLYLAKDHRKWIIQIIPLCLFSVVLGIRLSYAPLGIGILLLWWHEWKLLRSWKRIVILCSLAAFFQFIWLFALVAAEGGAASFLKLAFSFTNGHFQEWGGTAATEEHSYFQRMLTLIFFNIIWTAICNQSVLILCFYVIILFVLCIKGPSLKLDGWLAIMGMVYIIWALLGQNIDKPRHIIPAASIIMFYLWTHFLGGKLNVQKLLVVLAVLILQMTMVIMEMKKQSDSLPATYQLAYDLEDKREEFIVYTWEETRVLHYLQADFPHKAIYHFHAFLQDKENYDNDIIYLTDHVVKGFEKQGIDVKEKVKKVSVYKSSKLIDPVYGEITLYEWVK
ncbi:glycosyltransferase family protein [Priestia abyssalis]|uniref:glycosyltransferase family 39 protein n=1 Tax=Priestia abyssalis TaxID=1221450 RepID=UPI001116CBF7|nr:glycosyltransferase family 39 protein [Priestia abyssalis]